MRFDNIRAKENIYTRTLACPPIEQVEILLIYHKELLKAVKRDGVS